MDPRASSRTAFRGLFEEATRIFAQHDPMLIISTQHPDEYEPEVGTILPRLGTATDVADVEMIIRVEFDRWFYPGCLQKKQVGPLADDVWQAWLRSRAAHDRDEGEVP